MTWTDVTALLALVLGSVFAAYQAGKSHGFYEGITTERLRAAQPDREAE